MKNLFSTVGIIVSMVAIGQPVLACGGVGPDYKVNITTEGVNLRIQLIDDDGVTKTLLDDDGYASLYINAVGIGKGLEKGKKPSPAQIEFMRQRLAQLENKTLSYLVTGNASPIAISELKTKIVRLRSILNAAEITNPTALFDAVVEINRTLIRNVSTHEFVYEGTIPNKTPNSIIPLREFELPSMLLMRGCNSGISDISVPAQPAQSSISFEIQE